MADEKVDNKQKSISISEISLKSINCSECNKIIKKGEPYIKLILSEKVLCSECDQGLFIGDTFFSIE